MNQMQRMLQEAQRMQRKLNEMRAELMKKEFPVDKNGLVKVVLTGNKEVKEIHIDPEALIEDREMIEDSIKAAINVKKKHKDWNIVPEIMIPLTGEVKEMAFVKKFVVLVFKIDSFIV